MPVTLSSRTAAAASAAASSCRPAAMASAEMPVTTHRSSSPPCWYDSTCWGTASPTWNRVFPASERSNAKPWQQSRPPATMSRCSAWNARLASTRPKFRYHRTRFACFSSASASASWCRRPPAGAAAAPLAASSSTASSSGSSRRPHPLRPGHAVALRPGIAMAPRDRLHRAGTACRCPATSARLARSLCLCSTASRSPPQPVRTTGVRRGVGWGAVNLTVWITFQLPGGPSASK